MEQVFYTAGAIPLFLVIAGTMSRAGKETPPWIRRVLIFSPFFYLFQATGAIPMVQQAIALIPPLNQTNFYGFFPPLLILPIAWISASYFQNPVRSKAAFYTFLIVLIPLAYLSYKYTHPFPEGRFLRLVPGVIVAIAFTFFLRGAKSGPLFFIVVLALVYVETSAIHMGFHFKKAAEIETIQFGSPDPKTWEPLCRLPEANNYRFFWWQNFIPRKMCLSLPDSPMSATHLPQNEKLKGILFERSMFLDAPLHDYSWQLMSVRWLGANDKIKKDLKKLNIPFKIISPLPEVYEKKNDLIEIENALPRAYLTRQCRRFDDEIKLTETLRKGDFALGEALFVSNSDSPSLPCTNVPSAIQKVSIKSDRGQMLELSEIQGPGILVINDSFYPGWRAFNFDGEFNIANRGIIEFIEVLKLDVAFLYDLLGASQEHKVKPKKFPQTDIDEVIIGHTNEPEYRKLQNNEFMEALRDRTVKIDVPYITKLSTKTTYRSFI
jgi:hypothetical protein